MHLNHTVTIHQTGLASPTIQGSEVRGSVVLRTPKTSKRIHREREKEREREMEENRRVGVALDFSPCSKKALKWAVDNLVREGDYLILITIRPEGNYEDGEVQLWAVDGSRNFLQYFLSEFKIFCVVSWRISFTTAVLNGCLFICACV